MKKKIVYIAHKIGGDVEGNVKKVLDIVRRISIENKYIPFAPYIVDVQALDDTVPEEREIGMMHNRHFFELGIIDEMHIYSEISSGIQREIGWCNEFNIPVKQMW